MAQYRKKPVVIEAFQYKYNKNNETVAYPTWFLKAVGEGYVYESNTGHTMIKTLEGDMLVSEDDYIIKGVTGELYPCKPDIFAATYEAV